MASPDLSGQVPCRIANHRLTPRKDVDDPALVRQEMEGQERMYMYVATVIYLLHSYATNDVVAKAASKIELFKKSPL